MTNYFEFLKVEDILSKKTNKLKISGSENVNCPFKKGTDKIEVREERAEHRQGKRGTPTRYQKPRFTA